MSSTGRPRLLDEEKRRHICALVGAGCGVQDAARHIGCSVNTIRRELLRNPEFKKRLRDARLHSQLEPLRAMRAAAATHWRAAAWMLERTNPRQFARSSLKGYNFEEVQELFDDAIDVACEEINDDDVRRRVCRNLRLAAHYMFDEDAIRRFNRRALTRGASTLEDRAMETILGDVEESSREALRSIAKDSLKRRQPK